MIAANDHLAAVDGGDALLATRFRLADDHLLDQTLFLQKHAGAVRKAVLRIDGGFNFEVDLSQGAFQLVSRLDGRPLGDVLGELAAELNGRTQEELSSEALATVRGLFELGFLVRAEDS
jgi:hypothetical protein